MNYMKEKLGKIKLVEYLIRYPTPKSNEYKPTK